MNLKFSLIVFLLPLFGIFIFLYMLGLNFNFPKLPKDSRNPNMYEILYYNTALISNDASFCRKISDKSYQSTNFAVKKGYQIKFLRSACFGELAIKKSDPKLCDSIIVANSWFSDGSEYNPTKCRSNIAVGISSVSSGSFLPLSSLETLFKGLGYTPNDIQIGPNDDYEFALRDYWSKLELTPSFWDKVRSLPNY